MVYLEQQKRPIQILHVIQGKHFGGAEQVVLCLSKSVDYNQVIPTVVCLSEGRLQEMLTESGIANFLIPMNSKMDIIVPLQKIVKLIIKKRIDIIHTHTVRSNLIGRLSSFFTRRKCVTHLHSPIARDFADLKRGKRNELIDSLTRPIASHYISVSHSLRREIIEKGMNPQNITTVHNGLDLNAINISSPKQIQNGCIKREFNLPDDAILLVLVALIRPRKGVEVIIQAINNFKNKFPNAFLLIVGNDDISEDPTYGNRLRELAIKFNIESRIIFTGFRDDVISILKQCDLLVLPSLFGEGFPMVILEAMSVGLPVVASNIEGIPEVIKDQENGFLVSPGNHVELAEKISEALKNVDLLKLVKSNAIKTVSKEFDGKTQAKKVESIYRKILMP